MHRDINSSSSYYWSLLSTFLLLFLFLGHPFQASAQDTSNEEVKRVQRAIFIYNFANQIGWSDSEKMIDFKIGVLGPDRTIIDLQAMSRTRSIYNKPVKIVRFQSVKEVSGVQLLYVNKKYNFDLDYLLNKVSGKQILLVTEDYNYNSSMINMVNVKASFEYEINTDRLTAENFTYAPTLQKYAISSAEKWKELYQLTEKSLTELQKEKEAQEIELDDKNQDLEDKEETISDQEKEIISKEKFLKEKSAWIEKLGSENEIQKALYEDKVKIERELEKNILVQINFIRIQERVIDSTSRAIKKQEERLLDQNTEIKEKEIILAKQVSEISAQKKVNGLLAALVILALLGSFFIYRGYLAKKKLNTVLQEKKDEIETMAIELAFKNNELEQFAYIASHDLQEPLNTITSLIDLVKEDYDDELDDPGKQSLAFIQDSTRRMKSLINALLQHSRLGSMGSTSIVDCDLVVRNVREDIQDTIAETKAEIIVEDLPTLTGSEPEIRMVFQNLITNAIKFRTAGVIPSIYISCDKEVSRDDNSKEFWKFSVQDNGIGIPDLYKDRIFAIFQRLHSREEYEGTGIGLAHAKKVIEAHGGRIWLESEEGKGSTFYFTIPV